MRSPSLESTIFDPFTTRIDGVFLPSINRNTGFNVSEIHPPPAEIDDSESESSPVPRASKN